MRRGNTRETTSLKGLTKQEYGGKIELLSSTISEYESGGREREREKSLTHFFHHSEKLVGGCLIARANRSSCKDREREREEDTNRHINVDSNMYNVCSAVKLSPPNCCIFMASDKQCIVHNSFLLHF